MGGISIFARQFSQKSPLTRSNSFASTSMTTDFGGFLTQTFVCGSLYVSARLVEIIGLMPFFRTSIVATKATVFRQRVNPRGVPLRKATFPPSAVKIRWPVQSSGSALWKANAVSRSSRFASRY